MHTGLGTPPPADDNTHDHAWRKLESSVEQELDQYICDVCHKHWPTPPGDA